MILKVCFLLSPTETLIEVSKSILKRFFINSFFILEKKKFQKQHLIELIKLKIAFKKLN